MINNEEFKKELIDLLWKYQLSVSDFLNIVNKENAWIYVNKSKKLLNAINEGTEL